MDEIRELALIVSRAKLRDPFWPLTHETKNTELQALYENALSNGFEADEGQSKGTSDYHLRKQRLQLEEQLTNTLFLQDSRYFSDNERSRALYECAKGWAAMRILLLKDGRRTAIRVAEQTLKTALHYEFSEIAIDIARILRLHFGLREGDAKKFQHYDELCEQLGTIVAWEDMAEQLYARLTIHYVNNKSTKSDIAEQAKQALLKLKDGFEEAKTYRFLLSGYLLRLMISTSANDYTTAAEICREATSVFEEKPYYTHLPLQIFYYQALVCYTQLCDYDNGSDAARKCQRYLTEGSFNWFKYQELEFVLSMHTQRYQEAYHVFLRVVDNSRFNTMPEHVKETWKIYEAYLHFLLYLQHIEPADQDKRFNNFRLGRFLNNVPVYLKDKRGMNIPILVVHILLMIQQKRYDEAIDRMEAIAKYCTRYLTRDDNFRSNCFIKMLLLAPANSFHRAAVARKAEKLLAKLKTKPIEVAKQSHEIEIIPYEHLWELTLCSLDNAFVERKSERFRKHL